jgi:hypothetical protein
MTMPLGSGANSFLTIGLERGIWEIRVSVEFEAALRIRGRGGLFYMGEGRFDSWDDNRAFLQSTPAPLIPSENIIRLITHKSFF